MLEINNSKEYSVYPHINTMFLFYFLLQVTERSGELLKLHCYLGNWADHYVPGAGMYF